VDASDLATLVVLGPRRLVGTVETCSL